MAQKALEEEQLRRVRLYDRLNKGKQAEEEPGKNAAFIPFRAGHESSHALAIPHDAELAEGTVHPVVLYQGDRAAQTQRSGAVVPAGRRRGRRGRGRKARQAAAAAARGNYVDRAFNGESSQHAEWLRKMGAAMPEAPQSVTQAIPFQSANAAPAGGSRFSPSPAEAAVIRQVMHESVGQYQSAGAPPKVNDVLAAPLPKEQPQEDAPLHEGDRRIVPFDIFMEQGLAHKGGDTDRPAVPLKIGNQAVEAASHQSAVNKEIPEDKVLPPNVGGVPQTVLGQVPLPEKRTYTAVADDSEPDKEKMALGMLVKIFKAISTFINLKQNMLLRCHDLKGVHHHESHHHHHEELLHHHEKHHHHHEKHHHHHRKYRLGAVMMQVPQPVMMMQQPQPIVMQQQPAVMTVQQPSMMAVQQPNMIAVQQPSMMAGQQPCISICPPTEKDKETDY
jgi:hypothetical protein